MAIFMDNLSCHKSKFTIGKMDELQLVPIFNVVYFPDGNPIELVFSKVKREFKKAKLAKIVNNGTETIAQIIDKSFAKVTKNEVLNCISHAHK